MAHFAVRLVHGPGWDSTRPIREQDGWDEHAAFMDGLVDDGFVILGGPVGNGEQTLHVVETADERDVKEPSDTRDGHIWTGVCGAKRLRRTSRNLVAPSAAAVLGGREATAAMRVPSDSPDCRSSCPPYRNALTL
jgi:hypothetical protein